MRARDDKDDAAAADWMARRDRGLSADEQDAYLEWMMEARARGAAVADLERTWARLDSVRDWRPVHSALPNPDLLAVPRPRRRHLLALAAAIAVLVVCLLAPALVQTKPGSGAQIVPAPERLVLDDGSLVELNAGAQVEVEFSSEVRRVRLVRGEAHFTVAKNPSRPFVVDAGHFAVRAVGTAFLVQHGEAETAVTVTEGHVRMDFVPAPSEGAPPTDHLLADLLAGQQAIAGHAAEAGIPAVTLRHLEPLELDSAMAWRGIRLEFDDMPLHEVVKEFNRFNVRQLVIEDPATAQIRVGGNFRPENLNAFVRLLETGFGISAESHANEIVLRRR